MVRPLLPRTHYRRELDAVRHLARVVTKSVHEPAVWRDKATKLLDELRALFVAAEERVARKNTKGTESVEGDEPKKPQKRTKDR